MPTDDPKYEVARRRRMETRIVQDLTFDALLERRKKLADQCRRSDYPENFDIIMAKLLQAKEAKEKLLELADSSCSEGDDEEDADI